MHRPLTTATILAAAFGSSLLLHAAGTETSPVRVIVSNGIRTTVEELQPQAERAIGRPLVFEFGTTADLKTKIGGGAPFDAALLTSDAVDDLIKGSKIAGPSTPLARAGIGIGVRAGGPKPDIRTPDALKQTLRDAKSVAYAGNGASRMYIDQMMDRLGIASDMKTKIYLTQGSVAAGEHVAASQGSLVITLISEILPMKGIELVGPLPASLQNYVNFAGGVGAKAQSREAAAKLIQFLKGPAAASAYKAKGMEAR
jgi:molybdate transport system substrate-binding protein